MPHEDIPFDRLLAAIRKLPRDRQVELFEAVGLTAPNAGERPAPEAGSEYHCRKCGSMLGPGELPETCPSCGAPRRSFVIEAED